MDLGWTEKYEYPGIQLDASFRSAEGRRGSSQKLGRSVTRVHPLVEGFRHHAVSRGEKRDEIAAPTCRTAVRPYSPITEGQTR